MTLDDNNAHLPADGRHDSSIAAAVSRLAEEFADDLQPPVVRRVVLGSRRDLSGCPVTALPELVERLARERLLQSVSPQPGEQSVIREV